MNNKVKIAFLCILIIAIVYIYENREEKTPASNIIVMPTAVDLGLPSGLLWASHNIGATVPEEPGDYFAWGEIKTKRLYSRDTYKYYRTDSLSDGYTKYCHISSRGYKGYTDTLSMLELSDDVANVQLGGKWRIPTKEEWLELSRQCKQECCEVNG